MKNFIPFLGALVLSPTFAFSLTLGDSLPQIDQRLLNVDGKEISLSDMKGPKGTLVFFTCNHCPYVKAWESRTVALANQALKDGFGVIAINSNDTKASEADSFMEMQKRAKNVGKNYPYTLDITSQYAKAFGASKTPEFFLFNSEGKLVYEGALDDSAEDASKVKHQYLQDALNALKSGKPVAVAESKAIGCGIKMRN